ncbi:MAG TPA: response regulator transcription factor [Candidatus Aquilonibacter sp.]
MKAQSERVLIADDHPLFREAMKHVLDGVFGADLICEDVASFAELRRVTPGDDRYTMIVLDLQMPGGAWYDELIALRRRAPATPTIVVSSLEDPPTIAQVAESGVAGYIPKSASKHEMEEAVRLVLAGGSSFGTASSVSVAPDPPPADFEGLTARQLAVLEHLALGKSNREIAEALFVEEVTVKTHVTAILRKLGVRNRLQAALVLRRYRARQRGNT